MKRIVACTLVTIALFDSFASNRTLSKDNYIQNQIKIDNCSLNYLKISQNSKYIPGIDCLNISDFPVQGWNTTAYSNPFTENIDIVVFPSKKAQEEYISEFYKVLSNQKSEKNKDKKLKGILLENQFKESQSKIPIQVIKITDTPIKNWDAFIIDEDNDSTPDMIKFYTFHEDADKIKEVYYQKKVEYIIKKGIKEKG